MEKQIDESLFIKKAPSVIIRPSRKSIPERNGEVTICMGDAHIGYREKEPFHDERALLLGIIAVRQLCPDNIVLLGDMLDLPAMSRFSQRSDWQNSTQDSIDRYHLYLSELRANAPEANIIAIHGNHEMRQPNYIQKNAAELLGIKRANIQKELGVLTLQYLCRYDELNIKCVDGYPNATYWLEDDLKCVHGSNVSKGGSNAAKYLNQEMTSTIYGHTHRLELANKTISTRDGYKIISAASPGCLAKIDGTVPGHKHSIDGNNKTVFNAENWQQGLLVIFHDKNHHNIQPLTIDNDGINIFDKKYSK